MKYVVLFVSLIVIGFSYYSYQKNKTIKALTHNVNLNQKRIDFLIKNHNCKVSSINLLENELNHLAIRKGRLQKMTNSNRDYTDIPATISGIKKDCKL